MTSSSNSRGLHRRDFLGSVGAPLIVPAGALGRGSPPPSDRVTIGLIGSGGRGVFEASFYPHYTGCELIAICDVWEDRRVTAKSTFEKLYSDLRPERRHPGLRVYADFRELLRQKDIDALYIATIDHWHVAMTIAAMQAGKPCHTEKPLGISIEQDLAALKAVRRYDLPFLYGAERRSAPEARHAIELVLNGRIGKVKEIYVAAPAGRSGLSGAPQPVPPGLDWDAWLGPAPEVPFSKDRVLDGRFSVRDYSLGFIGNWGAHPLDQLQLWADHAGLTIPVTYQGTGTIPESGLCDCVSDWDLRLTYENGLIVRYLDSRSYAKAPDTPKVRVKPGEDLRNVTCFVGTEGWVAVAYEGVAAEPASLLTSEIGPKEIRLPRSPVSDEQAPKGLNTWQQSTARHQLGWIEYMTNWKSTKYQKPTVDPIDSAVRSDLITQLCDICIRTGRRIRWDPKKQTIIGDAEARKMMSRPMRDPWAKLVLG